MRAKGHTAVMADRASAAVIKREIDPLRKLYRQIDYFPTPPWATRALLNHVIPDAEGTAWEPACGEGHMAAVLEERFAYVLASDVHGHGFGAVGSFVGSGLDVIARTPGTYDWIITNPPFTLAADFVERALGEAAHGVAMLLRTPWLEGLDRYERLFRWIPPTTVAVFVERVPMTLGRWDPEADTATAYAWFVWRRSESPGQGRPGSWGQGGTALRWIPPGCRKGLEHANDRKRFAGANVLEPALFAGAGGQP